MMLRKQFLGIATTLLMSHCCAIASAKVDIGWQLERQLALVMNGELSPTEVVQHAEFSAAELVLFIEQNLDSVLAVTAILVSGYSADDVATELAIRLSSHSNNSIRIAATAALRQQFIKAKAEINPQTTVHGRLVRMIGYFEEVIGRFCRREATYPSLLLNFAAVSMADLSESEGKEWVVQFLRSDRVERGSYEYVCKYLSSKKQDWHQVVLSNERMQQAEYFKALGLDPS